MADPRIDKWARALAGYSVSIEPGQVVVINGQPAAARCADGGRICQVRFAKPLLVPHRHGLPAFVATCVA